MTSFDFKLRFHETTLREKIDYLMREDGYSQGQSTFFYKFSAGVHFRSNGEIISGFYQNINQFQRFGARRRGTPVRAWFRGRIKQNKDGTVSFKGIIFPDIKAFLISLVVLAIFISESVEPGGILLAAIGVGSITACLIKLEIDLYNFLKSFFE